jgi:hypothetical protein
LSQSEALVIAAGIIGLALVLGRPVQNINNSNTNLLTASADAQATGAQPKSGGGGPLSSVLGFLGI